MRSGERLVAAIEHREVDHIPLYFRIHDFVPPAELAWNNQYERVRRWLSVGVDDILIVPSPLVKNDFLGMGNPAQCTNGVTTKVTVIHEESEEYPIIVKEYLTPQGVLRHEVRKTEDWNRNKNLPYIRGRDDLLLFDDYNVSRARKPLIEDAHDIGKLKHLLANPSESTLNHHRMHAEEVKKQANQLGVLCATWSSTGVDTLIWLCGVENAILMLHDQPDVFEELLDIVHKRDLLATKICLDLDVDLILRRGWYEGCNIWSPTIYRRHFLPKVKKVAQLVRGAGKLFGYALPYGIMPILEDLVNIGYHVHWYVDDVQGDEDFHAVKSCFKGKIAILGGVNEAITLERGSSAAVKKAVSHAVSVLGTDSGFILSPTDALYSTTPWASVQSMIEAWNEIKHCLHRM